MIAVKIIALDPGNVYTAYVLGNENYEVFKKGKVENNEILSILAEEKPDIVVYEMIKSQGQAVGQTVFDTCIWIGRFIQFSESLNFKLYPIFRFEEKITICGTMKAKDTNIRRALIDRFSKHDMERGRGTKLNPDFFHNFKADIWMAFAVLVTFLDKIKEGELEININGKN